MDYIDKIEIKITNLNNKIELFIIPSTLKVYVKDKAKSIDKEQIDRLLRIICRWDYEYINNSIIDAQTFKIRVYSKNGVDEYFGCGKYPKNYHEFIELVRGIYE